METSLEQVSALYRAGRIDEAVLMLRTVASQGNPQALFALADLTWTGTHVPQDPARGRLLFEHAAERGHGQAALIVTNLLGSGVAGTRRWDVAVERLEAEAPLFPDRRRALDLVKAMDLDSNGDAVHVPDGERLSDCPDVRLYRGLVRPEECEHIRQSAEPLYEPSFIYNDAREKVRDTIRTSDGAPIHWLIEDPAIHAVNRRIAAISATAYEDGEPLQSLRYRPGQEYRPHYDFVTSGEVRRLWTALIYLNDGYEGGGTAFPRVGLEVRGKQGDVLLFGNAAPDGGPEPLAEHAGLPVTSGVKYLATRWIRESRWIP